MKLHNEASIIYKDKVISGNELLLSVEHYRNYMKEKVENYRPVALFFERSPELIITMFALLDLKITFIPIYSKQPEERIRYMLEKAEVSTVITNIKDWDLAKKIDINVIHIVDITNGARQEEKLKVTNNNKNDGAYILFTSGTTGVPKAVEIKRESLVNFIDGVCERIDFSSGKIMASFTNLSFDIFLLEAVLALSKGLTLVLATEEERKNASLISGLLQRYHVNMLQMTPSMIKMLLLYDRELRCFREIADLMVGGEAFPRDLLETLQKKTDAKIYNMYGPTEATIWATIAELTEDVIVHIGSPIKNTQIWLLDENLKEVDGGETGEICISGKCLAKGYYNDEKSTKEKFIEWKNGNRIYRTGDIGKYDKAGKLLILGRKDNQIKLHGHRIELEEIELVFRKVLPVEDAVVCCLQDENNESLVVIYQSENELDKEKIRKVLKQNLPDYMIPVRYIRKESFIYNANGKLDRKTMVEKYVLNLSVLPNEREVKLMHEISDIEQIIRNVLGEQNGEIDSIDSQMCLEDLGIDSLTYMKIIVEIEDTFGIEFAPDTLSLGYFKNVQDIEEQVNVLRKKERITDEENNKK